ncbi:MAG: hypothetical protein WAV28_09595 [Sedimentisphaerales bacterium]
MKLTITIHKEVEDYEEAGAILLQTQLLLVARKPINITAEVTGPVEVEPG